MAHTVVVAGVGPGLGESLVRRFAAEGCSVGLFARSESSLERLADDVTADTAGEALAVPTDIADRDAVAVGFDAVREAFGPVDTLINHASAASWRGLRDADAEGFRRALAVNVEGAFHCSQEAVADMLDGERDDERGADDAAGTIIFTGATTSVRGRKGAVGFSAAKFGARGLAESMARELGPEGIHVAHVVLDGQILSPGGATGARPEHEFLDPDAIADEYWHLVQQDRSTWTLELDLRPHVEEF